MDKQERAKKKETAGQAALFPYLHSPFFPLVFPSPHPIPSHSTLRLKRT